MLAFVISLAVALAPVPAALSPEAGEHNTKAMQFYDNRQFERAFEEFQAAYNTMPDPRRDRAGRELLLGSMRATLLDLYDATGEPGPLCRLQAVLQAHKDALTTAFPDDPEMLEIRSARARHEEVTRQLAAFDPEACKPPPPPPLLPATTVHPASGPVAPTPAPTPTPSEPSADRTAGRGQIIAGAVLLPLGLVTLGTIGAVSGNYRRDLTAADDLHNALAKRRCTDDDRTRMSDLLTSTRRQEGLMVALGVTGGALVTAGTALLVRGGLQRRRARLAADIRSTFLGLTIWGEF